MTTNEQIASQRASNRKWLLNRLMSAKSVLKSQYRMQFKSPRFDFDMKRLYGDSGYYLQWKLRDEPNEPQSHENQQTNSGTVKLYREEETK